MSVKKFAGCVFAGAVASALSVPVAQAAASLLVNDESPLTVQTPPGFSYVTTGTTSALNVTTDGYLLCANIYYAPAVPASQVALAPMHTRWTLPTAVDAQTVTYSNGILRVNKPVTGASLETTLVCHERGLNGEIANPFSGYGAGIFDDGLEAFAATQYANMVNWIPAPGFSWSAPDWAQVPTDPCNFDRSVADSPIDPETSLCAAATGVSPGAHGTDQRAATMWTQAVGSSFIYLARIDGRLGAQTSGPNANFGTLASTQGVQDSPNSVDTEIRDGFDSQYLSATGTYCLLEQLPTALTTSVCSGAPVSGPLTGPLQTHFTLSMFFPSAPATSFYVVAIRTVTSNLPPINTPVAAISVLADPGTVRHDGGDGFTGDDVVFAFPNGGGFSWMGGQ